MCKTLIEMHHLKITFNENDVEDMFSKIIGMRFSTIAMVEKWIFEKLQATKKVCQILCSRNQRLMMKFYSEMLM